MAEDFFKTLKPRDCPTELDEVNRFLSEPVMATENVKRFPVVQRLFRHYNTTLPSSASVERLFSADGQISSLPLTDYQINILNI